MPNADIGTHISYDGLGRVVKLENPDETYSEHTYGPGTVTIRDEKGRLTVHALQAFGNPNDTRLVALTDADNKSWTYTYDTPGNLRAVVAADGKTRTWTYNAKNLLTSETHPESGTTTYNTHDAAGILKEKTDAKGQTFSYDHDGSDRLEEITAGTRVTTITYEPDSDNRAKTTIAGVEITHLYDAAGRPSGSHHVIGNKVLDSRFEYDANDNLKTVLYPSKRRVAYEFDAENRMTKVRDVTAGRDYATGFTYHPSGAVTRYVAGNTIPTDFSYHATRHWLTDIKAGATTLELQYRGFDEVGNVGTIDVIRDPGGAAASHPTHQETFSYDNLDRLTEATGRYGTLTYDYDEHGNRIDAGGAIYTYHGNTMRLATQNGDSFGYDDNGNLTSVAGSTSATYTYTPSNMLETVNNGAATYTYDGDDWRVKKTVGGVTTYSVRGLARELLTEVVPPADGKEGFRDYIYAGSRLLAVVER